MKTLKESIIFCLILWLILIFIIGCSGERFGTIIPENHQPIQSSEVLPFIVSEDRDTITGEGVWGLYQGYIDFEKLEGELVPIRSLGNGSTDSIEVDITAFLRESPCTDCAKIMGLAVDGSGNPIAVIGIKHPFPAGDPTKPATAVNRLDLHLFNVRGFIISDGYAEKKIFGATGKTIGGFTLLSADGLSGEFDTYWDNYYLTESNLHPYVLHYDDYSIGNFDPTNPNGFTDKVNPSGNLVMKMGSDYDQQNYVFKFEYTGSTRLDFFYAVTASYGISAVGKKQRLDPTYRIPQFNSKAASEVRVAEVDDSQLLSGDAGSKCYVTLEVMDINHGVSVGEGIDQMSADSSVIKIDVEIPGVTNPIWSTTAPADFYISGDGRNEPLVYNLQVTNDAAADVGTYTGIVKVVDAFIGNGNLPGNAVYMVPPDQDPTQAFFSVAEWATYTTFDVVVHQACGPISGSITNPNQPSITINDDDTVGFSGQGSSANGGNPITQYKWTWGDGTSFTLGQNVQHKFDNPNCEGNMQQINYTVKLILTDSCQPPNITEVDSVTVTVTCPTCFNYFENFDGGTDGKWDVEDWTIENTDDSSLYYGGWDQYTNHASGPNCTQSMCASGNCYFTSGDNIAEGMSPGFCNDYSGTGHYYLTSPVIDLTLLQVTEVTMTVKHFFNVLNASTRDGCAVYASTNAGVSFPYHVEVLSGEGYNSTFNAGARNGDACFTGFIPAGIVTTTVFNLTPFKGQDEVMIRFEEHNNNMGAIGTPGFPVGWWVDEILIDICP